MTKLKLFPVPHLQQLVTLDQIVKEFQRVSKARGANHLFLQLRAAKYTSSNSLDESKGCWPSPYTLYPYLLGMTSSSQGLLFPIVPALRTINGRATFENLYLPACSRSYSTTFEDRDVLDGRNSQAQKYVVFSVHPAQNQILGDNCTRNLCFLF